MPDVDKSIVYQSVANAIIKQVGSTGAPLASCKVQKNDPGGINFVITTARQWESFKAAEHFLRALEEAKIIKNPKYPNNGSELRDKDKPVAVAQGVSLSASRGTDDVIIHFDNPPTLDELGAAFAGAVKNTIGSGLSYDMHQAGEALPVIDATMRVIAERLRAVVATKERK